MRIAVIGSGRIGAIHASTLLAEDRVGEVLVVDADARRSEALARSLGCRAVADPDQVWDERPDGIVVASATPTHTGLVSRSLDAGLPVFCEKPLTRSLAESREIAARERQQGTPVMVGFQRRFDAAFGAFRSAVLSGGYGVPYLLSLRHGDVGAPPPGYLATSGSIFVDMCIHDLDAVRWITGCEAEAVTALGVRRMPGNDEFERYGDVDTAAATIQLADGPLASLECFRHSARGYLVGAEVFGSDGCGSLETDTNAGARPRSFLDRFEGAFRSEMNAFVSVVARERENPSDADNATETLRLALAAELSFRERRLVRIDELGA